MSTKRIILFFLCPILLSFILHVHVFKLDLIGYHVWRQTQTQTVIYNFNFSDNSILHPQRFDLSTGTTELLYEFPLYQWLIAQVNSVLGYSVMHSRIVTFILFAFFLWGFFRLLKKFVSLKIALITNSFLCFSPHLYYYCVNPLPDIMALTLATWALYFFFSFLHSYKYIYFIGFALLIVLAGLVKLPYVLFGGVFVPYFFAQIRTKQFKKLSLQLLILLVSAIPFILWYAKAIPTWTENGITKGMISNDKTILQLLDYFQHSLISSVPELLTNYATCAFLFMGIFLFFKHKKYCAEQPHYFVIVFFHFALYFLFELNMIEKTHDYYLMPFVPLIFLVVAYGLTYFEAKGYTKFIMLIIVISPLTAWLRIDQRWNSEDPGFTKDYLTYQREIQLIIPPKEICIIDSDDSKFITLYYLKRKGYSLLKEELNSNVLKTYYLKGANYLLTNNESFKESDYPEFHLQNVFSENIKIYKITKK